MANLFRAQWYRLFCRPSTAILLLVMAALAGPVAVQFTASWTDCHTFRAVLGRASVVEVCGPFVGLFLAAAIIAATLLTSGLGFWFCQSAALSLPSPVGAFVEQEVLPLSLTQIRLNLLNGLPIEVWWLADGALVTAAATVAIMVVMARRELR